MPITVNRTPGDPTQLWREYAAWLAEHLPHGAARLNPPADEAAIADLERLIGHELPEPVKAGWRLHDGQRCEDDFGAALGFWWQPVAEVAREWNSWREIREENDEEFFESLDASQQSYPRQAIKRQYSSPGWIPLLRWPFDGDYVGLDVDPGPEGTPGQVINFGRDQENKFVIADNFAVLLAWIVQEAKAGRVKFIDGDEPELEHEDGILVNALEEASGTEFD